MNIDNRSQLLPAEQLKSSPCQIDQLADADLAHIFKYVPPHDRLFLSLVSKRWYGINARDWLDIIRLDLSLIPNESIAAVISRCPKIQSICASRKAFGEKELHCLSRVKVSSIKLVQCTAKIPPESGKNIARVDVLSAVFSSSFKDSLTLQELLLVDFGVDVDVIDFDFTSHEPFLNLRASSLPASLKRLQISGPRQANADEYGHPCWLWELEQLRNLDCLLLQGALRPTLLQPGLFSRIDKLANLRELFLDVHLYACTINMSNIALRMPKLEVLFLVDSTGLASDAFEGLTTKQPSLRVLLISGTVGSETSIPMPVRRFYPNGVGSKPLPVLHVFVDQATIAKLSGSNASNALKLYPMNEPLEQFIDRPEVAQLLEGVWIAEQIRVTAGSGLSFPPVTPLAPLVFGE